MAMTDTLLGLLETDEQGLRGLFQQFGLGGGKGLTSGQQQFGTQLFQPFFSKFLGNMTKELDEGIPEGKLTGFKGFLGTSGFDFQRELLKGSAFETGATNQAVLGRGRTAFNF